MIEPAYPKQVIRREVIYFWTGTHIVQTRLARFFLHLAMWIDNVPREHF